MWNPKIYFPIPYHLFFHCWFNSGNFYFPIWNSLIYLSLLVFCVQPFISSRYLINSFVTLTAPSHIYIPDFKVIILFHGHLRILPFMSYLKHGERLLKTKNMIYNILYEMDHSTCCQLHFHIFFKIWHLFFWMIFIDENIYWSFHLLVD